MWEGQLSCCFSVYCYCSGMDGIQNVGEGYSTFRLRHIPSFLTVSLNSKKPVPAEGPAIEPRASETETGGNWPLFPFFKCSSEITSTNCIWKQKKLSLENLTPCFPRFTLLLFQFMTTSPSPSGPDLGSKGWHGLLYHHQCHMVSHMQSQ